MSLSLEAAFNMAVNIQAKSMTYYRLSNNTEYTLSVAQSNYFRNYAVIEEVVSEGREFVISKKEFERVLSSGQPVRGDRIIHSDMGNFTIREVIEMQALGNIIGFRLRCD